MSRGPVPSRLCHFPSLPECGLGEKVRFLGCVTSYSTASASLELGYRGSAVVVVVDVKLVLRALGEELTRVGEWVNVIGYVVGVDGASARVQALMVWSTGPLDLGRYEGSFEGAAFSDGG
ncbi:telomere capping, CST complex subunit domain-containing protein [Ophiocordyceps camponoti-floridani]|uniref:Telomere capping, CST complex subunit domain-containing protein n=1 Tax=Ophiocordyceps camponoti-floridani TaxID=2030778 RepID=A0A8H4VBV3_9HYPO|nr:telomere capping, CST complex subunit domain-containing protein [Ophiocordyceps camponoti-floridani]